MEKECNRCKARFNATTESQSICANCLAEEFGSAATAASEEVAPEIAIHHRLKKRQMARAEKMQRRLATGSSYSNKSRVLGLLGLVLFLACSFIFMLGDSDTYKTPINQLDVEYQLSISIACGLISICCLISSFRNNKVLVSMLMVIILGWSIALPFVWHARVPGEGDEEVETEENRVAKTAEEAAPVKGGSVMTDGDLEVFRTLCSEVPRQVHFAIYMDNQTSASRALVRESLTRLLQAEYTRAYTRGRGALFVVANARVAQHHLPLILSRYGQLMYSNANRRVYELHFSAERAQLVSRYASDVLESANNPNFVAANVSELTSLDPMRVRAAAHMLANADVQVLRGDIKNALMRVLQDPWQTEPETYQALVEALVVYAPPHDKEALRYFHNYFDGFRLTSRTLSEKVVRRLVTEDPDSMIEPVVQMWLGNPVAWGEILSLMENRVENALLARVTAKSDLKILDDSLKFFADYGTSKALPLVEELTGHRDSLISHKAHQTLEKIKNRHPN